MKRADYAVQRAYAAIICALVESGHVMTVDEALWAGVLTPAEFAACIAHYVGGKQ